jgi:YesN/AraC family two-component response regulator
MKVLIVEDDAPSRSFMKDTVESQGFETFTAENGLQGLMNFKKVNPDLVLSDINMPKVNGLELLEEIRRISPNVIVVMVTAFGCEEYAIKAMELRANNYLKKPVRHNELLPLLKKYASLTQKPTEPFEQPEEVNKPIYSLDLGSDIKKVPNMVYFLIEAAKNLLDERDTLDVKIGLMELLNNAIKHGNLANPNESDSAKKAIAYSRTVNVQFRICEPYCEWVITDEGKGFDWQAHMDRLLVDPLEQEGKGLLVSKFHFTELLFNPSGNSVTARKKISGV